MRLTQRQLKQIIREVYSRIHQQELFQEARYEWMNQKRGAFPFSNEQWASMPQEEKAAYGRWRFGGWDGPESEPASNGPEDKAFEVIEILEKHGIEVDLEPGWEEDLEDGYPVDLIYIDDGSVAFPEISDTSLSVKKIVKHILRNK